MQAIRPGTVWRDNVVTSPSGHGIVVYDYCSSFHNLSVAALCWLTVRALRDHSWEARDFVTGGVVGMTMVLCNLARLCLMAWDADLYQYWHNGPGTIIFNIGASTVVFLISFYGSRADSRATSALRAWAGHTVFAAVLIGSLAAQERVADWFEDDASLLEPADFAYCGLARASLA